VLTTSHDVVEPEKIHFLNDVLGRILVNFVHLMIAFFGIDYSELVSGGNHTVNDSRQIVDSSDEQKKETYI
jgi:hypothetical protein